MSLRGLPQCRKGIALLPAALSLFAWLLLIPQPGWCRTGDEGIGTDESLTMFQDIPVVYGASKYEQKASEAPSMVTVVTAEEIKLYGYRNLADILRSVGSAFVSFDRNYVYPGVRGFSRPGDYSSRFLVVVDGVRINDGIFQMAPIGNEFPIDVDLIDRVEFIRGPGSSLYGTDAFLGVVNIITKRGRDYKGTQLAGSAASYDTYKGRATYGNRFQNGVEMLVSGTYADSGGQDLYFKRYDRPYTNNGVAVNCDDENAYKLFSRVFYQDFTFEGAYSRREKGVPTGAFETVFNDSQTRTYDRYGFLSLKYDHTFTNDLNLMFQTYYYGSKYDGHWMYNFGNRLHPIYNLGTDSGYNQRINTQLQLTYTFLDKHKIILGTETTYNFQADQSFNDLETHFQDDRSLTDWALYVQDEYRVFDWLRLNAGLRYDHYTTFGGTFNPRLALIYNPFPSTALKAIYGSAFRAPSAYELYYHASFSNKANPNLEPETMSTYELIWEQQLPLGFRLNVGGFYYRIGDLITQTVDPADGLLVYRNLEQVEGKGVELELERQWFDSITGRFGYTFVNASLGGSDQALFNSPEHMVKANVSAPLIKKRLFLSTEAQYLSKRKTVSSAYADDFIVVNLTLYWANVLKNLDLSATVYNLFDEHYGDPVGAELRQRTIMQDGRNFRVKLMYSF